jgi:tripartite-type tricarboxylate transporter receptor subunit TctC
MLRIIAAAFSAVLALSPVAVLAQAYPSKPIRFVLPFGAGSATDALARIVAQDLEQTFGQPVMVLPKPGADGALAAGEVKRSAADGYTFLFGTNSPLAVAPNMQKEPPYDVLADFTPVTFMGENTFFIVVHPSLPVTSLAELIAFAKASPKPVNYATGNTYAFVSMAMLGANNGIKLEAIRYKSEPDAMADLLSGRVPLMNSTSTSSLAHVKAGKLRALSTGFEGRSPLLPELPSFAEAGQKKLPISPWFALVGPAGLPPEVVATMNKAMVATLAKPSVKEQMQRHGFLPRTSTPSELSAFMKEQLAVWKVALKDAGIEPQ